MDSAAYDVLLIAEVTIDETLRQFGVVAEIPAPVKDLLNTLIVSYNVARSAWLTYRAAVASKTASLQRSPTRSKVSPGAGSKTPRHMPIQFSPTPRERSTPRSAAS